MPKASEDGHIIQFRAPQPLWEKFQHSCKVNHITASEAFRQFMRTYVAQEEIIKEKNEQLREKLLEVEERREVLKGDISNVAKQLTEQHNAVRSSRASKEEESM